MRIHAKQTLVGSCALLTAAGVASPAQAKDLIEYFQPTPIVGALSSTAWGAEAVGPRDQSNGLEDAKMASYSYWDGQILRGPDGKYHMFASRWAQSKGMSGWSGSIAVHAISDTLYGPYVDKGQAYTDSNGKGHNVTAALLPDGRYTIIVSDTRPGDIFLSTSVNGPWTFQGSITVNANGYDASGTTKNLSLTILPDKSYLMATRFGAMMTSTDLMNWTVRGPRVFTTPAGYPAGSREDPVVWCSGGQFHMVYNYYDLRKARHMTSPNGISNWKDVGLAYDPTANFVRYTDGTVNHWYKMERAGVYMENGHVVAFTFAVIDVDKALDLGNDQHGTKIIVVPFDGVTFDADTGIAGSTACSTYSANSGVPGTTNGTGGTGGTGGATATGGASSVGGTKAAGGTSATGGSRSAGGSSAATTGGSSATGNASGGALSTGGSKAAGGTITADYTGGTANATGGSAATTGGKSATTSGAIGGAIASASGGATAAVGDAVTVGGAVANAGSSAVAGSDNGGNSTLTGGPSDTGSCSCRVPSGGQSRSGNTAKFAAVALAFAAFARRHRRTTRPRKSSDC